MCVFRDKDYRILLQIQAEGAPQMKEGGLFIIRGKDFKETRPFTFSAVLPMINPGRPVRATVPMTIKRTSCRLA